MSSDARIQLRPKPCDASRRRRLIEEVFPVADVVVGNNRHHAGVRVVGSPGVDVLIHPVVICILRDVADFEAKVGRVLNRRRCAVHHGVDETIFGVAEEGGIRSR